MIPSTCPVCGATSITPPERTSALLAVCDVLCLKVLETMGKFILRHGRARIYELHGQPPHMAHTLWPLEEQYVNKALKGAWDVVPAMLDVHGCCNVAPRQVTEMLDSYVRDLVITGTPHDICELAYRFEAYLGLPVHLVREEESDDDDAGLLAPVPAEA